MKANEKKKLSPLTAADLPEGWGCRAGFGIKAVVPGVAREYMPGIQSILLPAPIGFRGESTS